VKASDVRSIENNQLQKQTVLKSLRYSAFFPRCSSVHSSRARFEQFCKTLRHMRQQTKQGARTARSSLLNKFFTAWAACLGSLGKSAQKHHKVQTNWTNKQNPPAAVYSCMYNFLSISRFSGVSGCDSAKS